MSEDRVKAVAAMKPIKTQEEIAAELGVCRSTVQRDLAIVKRDGLEIPVLSIEAAEIRAKEVESIKEEIIFLRADAESLPVSPRQIDLRARILDRRIKLLELFTPKVVGHVDLNETAQGIYPEFMQTMNRRWNQWNRIKAWIRSLPNDDEVVEGEQV